MSETPKTYESDTPETCEAVERWQQGKINIFDEMARLERERDEARELAKAYKEYAQLLCDELNETVGLAHVHGWRSFRFEQGQVLREKIKQLEAAK